MFFTATCVCRILACAAALTQGIALAGPVGQRDQAPIPRRATGGFAKGIWLRVMPLGASITYGLTSHDGNGYRKYLRDMIVDYGNDVNMVGSRRNGSMEDNDVEGWPGYVIDQVHTKANAAVPKYKPNLVLVNVGTNDCSGYVDLANAGKRNEEKQECVVNLNSQFKTVAAAQRENGRRLVVVDMQPPAGPTTTELVDGTHPTEAGYAKMATIWFNGIKEADKAGFLLTKEAIPGNADGVPDRGVYS